MDTASAPAARNQEFATATERPLRVVSLVTNLYAAGDASRLLAYSRAADPKRVDHSILLLVRPDDESIRAHGPMLERFKEHGIRVDSLNEIPRVQGRSRSGSLRRAFREAATFGRILRSLRKYFREHAVDVVDARPGYGILFGALAGRAARVPVICATEYGTEFWKAPVLWAAGQLCFRLIDVFVSDSDARLEQYRKWCRLGMRRTAVIENGIFTPRPARTPEAMRRELGLPEDPRVRIIAQVSRLIRYKGHRILIEAVRRVLESEPQVALLVCGFSHDTAYRDELDRLVGDLGIRERVRIVGYPGPIADVWQVVDIHAHASLYDSSPIAIHESMALGKPAVVSNVGGIPRLVSNEQTGIVVPANDAKALAEGLLRVLRDPALAKRIGRAAQERFESRYRAERMAERTDELFKSIFASKQGMGFSR